MYEENRDGDYRGCRMLCGLLRGSVQIRMESEAVCFLSVYGEKRPPQRQFEINRILVCRGRNNTATANEVRYLTQSN